MKKIIYIVLILLSIFTFYLLFGHKPIYEGIQVGITEFTSQNGLELIQTKKNKCGNYISTNYIIRYNDKQKKNENIYHSTNIYDSNSNYIGQIAGDGPGLSMMFGDSTKIISALNENCSYSLPPGGTTSIDNCGNKVVTDINGTIISTLDSNGYTVTTQCTK